MSVQKQENPNQTLLSLLDLQSIDNDTFSADTPYTNVQRVFGGQVAAQALVAAQKTVEEEFYVHYVHCSFMRPGDPHIPIHYQVERSKDGKAFCNRTVTAVQGGEKIFMMMAGFHIEEKGPEHQLFEPTAPDPDEVAHVLPEMKKRGVPWFIDSFPGMEAIDIRLVEPLDMLAFKQSKEVQLWFKAAEEIGDDSRLNSAFFTFASDTAILLPTFLPHMPTPTTRFQLASLNHSIFFHQRIDFNDFLLYDIRSCRAFGARGIAQGHVYNRQGSLVATVTQEGLVRPIGDNGDYASQFDKKGHLINP